MALSGKLDEVGEADRWIWERLGHIWERLGCWTGSSQQPRRLIKTFMESYLLKAFLNKVEEALAKANWLRPASMETVLALAIWSKVLFCIFSSFHAVRRFVCWFMLRVEPFVLLWLHCKHSSGAGSRRFRRFFCIFIW